MKCGVIFDLDGLLLDSERVYTIVGQELLAPYDLTFDYALKAAMMGQPALEAMQCLIDQTKIPLSATEALARQDKRKDELFRQVQPLPGAMKLLQHLQKHGIPMAIATGSRVETFELKTRHLPELLACFPDEKTIITADKVKPGRGKPEPDQFIMAAASINVAPEACLVFEDGLPGIQGARRGGITSIWVPDPELRAYRNAKEPGTPESSLGQAEILASLADFVPEKYGLPPYDAS